MAITARQARRFLGQPVCVQGPGGKKYYGIVQEVTSTGIRLQPFGPKGPINGRSAKQVDATTADKPKGIQAEPAFLGWLLPLASLFALRPFRGGNGFGNLFGRFGGNPGGNEGNPGGTGGYRGFGGFGGGFPGTGRFGGFPWTWGNPGVGRGQPDGTSGQGGAGPLGVFGGWPWSGLWF